MTAQDFIDKCNQLVNDITGQCIILIYSHSFNACSDNPEAEFSIKVKMYKDTPTPQIVENKNEPLH